MDWELQKRNQRSEDHMSSLISTRSCLLGPSRYTSFLVCTASSPVHLDMQGPPVWAGSCLSHESSRIGSNTTQAAAALGVFIQCRGDKYFPLVTFLVKNSFTTLVPIGTKVQEASCLRKRSIHPHPTAQNLYSKKQFTQMKIYYSQLSSHLRYG